MRTSRKENIVKLKKFLEDERNASKRDTKSVGGNRGMGKPKQRS